MLSRYDALIEDIKIEGIGTFTFSGLWELNKKISPAWCILPANLYIHGNEGSLNSEMIAFIRSLIANTTFKNIFEGHVYKYYTENIYPALTSQAGQEDGYDFPKINSPKDIWVLLGKFIDIYIIGIEEFEISCKCIWDAEHGLALKVKNWIIS